MAPTYKVAIVQFDPKELAVAANFKKAEGYLRSAASQGASLAVLPEFHLTSWVPGHDEFFATCVESATYLARYQALARELNMNIVPGTICIPFNTREDDDQDSDGLRNMAFFLAAGTGEICGSYQKKNLWHTERGHLTSSGREPHLAFDTPLKHADGTPVRAGMLICWDLAFPEAFRALVNDGAELIIIPSYWYLTDAGEEGVALNPDAEKIFLESAVTMRAFENTAAVVYSNTGGCSAVAMPIQGMLACMDAEEEGVRVVNIDLDVLRIAESTYKIRKDLDSEDWHYGYSHPHGR